MVVSKGFLHGSEVPTPLLTCGFWRVLHFVQFKQFWSHGGPTVPSYLFHTGRFWDIVDLIVMNIILYIYIVYIMYVLTIPTLPFWERHLNLTHLPQRSALWAFDCAKAPRIPLELALQAHPIQSFPLPKPLTTKRVGQPLKRLWCLGKALMKFCWKTFINCARLNYLA